MLNAGSGLSISRSDKIRGPFALPIPASYSDRTAMSPHIHKHCQFPSYLATLFSMVNHTKPSLFRLMFKDPVAEFGQYAEGK